MAKAPVVTKGSKYGIYSTMLKETIQTKKPKGERYTKVIEMKMTLKESTAVGKKPSPGYRVMFDKYNGFTVNLDSLDWPDKIKRDAVKIFEIDRMIWKVTDEELTIHDEIRAEEKKLKDFKAKRVVKLNQLAEVQEKETLSQLKNNG